MEEEMKRNQEEMEAMKKSWEERMKESNDANAVSLYGQSTVRDIRFPH